MSEVQKILQTTIGTAALYGLEMKASQIREITTQAEQALYDLLMEKATTLWHDGSDLNKKLPKPVKAIPISTINELFGRTE